MPELPEVETVCRALSNVVSSLKVKKVWLLRKNLRWPFPKNIEKRLVNETFLSPFRKGKYILIPTKNKNILLIHLGMSGSIKIEDKTTTLKKHDHFRIELEQKSKKIIITYNDPRRFGFIDFFEEVKIKEHFLLKNLGIEPLSKFLTIETLKHKFKKKNTNIKTTLLDQKIISGIGNIYASEILFDAKILPYANTNSLTNKKIEMLINSIKFILENAIKAGGTTIRNHLQPDGKIGYFSQKLLVYGKKDLPCSICKNVIKYIEINKRSTFFCKKCQK